MDLAWTRIRSGITLCLAVLYLSNLFVKSPLLENFDIVLVALVLLLSLIAVSGTSRIISYIFFAVSMSLLVFYKAPLQVWVQALEENLYLVIMFAMVPLLGLPIRYGGYFETLKALFTRYVISDRRYYLLVSLLSALLGVLINMAIVPLMDQITQASKRSSDKKLVSSAISRGFATCTIWAPTTAAIGLILKLTAVKWTVFFPFGILFGCIAGFLGFGMHLLEEGRNEPNNAPNSADSAEEPNWLKLLELSIFGLGLILGVVLVSLLTGIQTIVAVTMVSFIFPLVWMGIIRRLSLLARAFKAEYFEESLPKLKNEVALFIGAGFLATSIAFSHLDDYFPRTMVQLVGNDPFWFAAVVVLSNLVLSAVGLHPIILVTIIGSAIQPAAFGLSPTFMALLLAVCWTSGMTISPAAGNVIAVAGITNRSPVSVGIAWNGPYAFACSVVLLSIMFALRAMGLL